MIAWPALEKDITNWLEDLVEKTTDDTATFFANSYASAVSDGVEPMMNAVIPPGKEAAIESAWKAAFAAQSKSDTAIGVPNWLPVEGAILAYWTAAMFQFATPHPGTVTGVSNITTAPGAPGIAAAIDKAFKQEDAAKTAAELVTGYKNHIGTVAGLFIGLTPPPASAPLPVPWAGIK